MHRSRPSGICSGDIFSCSLVLHTLAPVICRGLAQCGPTTACSAFWSGSRVPASPVYSSGLIRPWWWQPDSSHTHTYGSRIVSTWIQGGWQVGSVWLTPQPKGGLTMIPQKVRSDHSVGGMHWIIYASFPSRQYPLISPEISPSRRRHKWSCHTCRGHCQ